VFDEMNGVHFMYCFSVQNTVFVPYTSSPPYRLVSRALDRPTNGNGNGNSNGNGTMTMAMATAAKMTATTTTSPTSQSNQTRSQSIKSIGTYSGARQPKEAWIVQIMGL
jgi:hypothetical protein